LAKRLIGENMNKSPFIASLVATPICIYLAAVSAGAGHGSYLWAKILFPYTMLSILIFGLSAPLIRIGIWLLTFIQIPLYGIILGFACQKQRFSRIIVALLAAHLLAIVIYMLFANGNFG
jgi:hypothetical protein